MCPPRPIQQSSCSKQPIMQPSFDPANTISDSLENGAVLRDATDGRWLLFRRPLRIFHATEPASVLRVLRAVEREVAVNRLYAAGFLAYEAAPAFDPALAVKPPGDFPLVWFGIYREPEPLPALAPAPNQSMTLPWQACVSETEYQRALGRIKAYIRAGDSYQVNYSFRMRAAFAGDPWRLFLSMVKSQGDGYGGYLDIGEWTICSASPELFFRLDGETLLSRPMKGTAARGLQREEDLENARWLRGSPKNRAENVMIVDMVRNDLGRIAALGSVKVTSLFEVEQYPTLWQMTSTIQGSTGAGIADIFQALFPAASITGAPKASTMAIIAELENEPRRIYTGAIGFISPGHKAQFNVAIRTVLVDKRRRLAEYGVGGGIVWDSEDRAEWRECHTKAAILFQPPPDFALLETLRWTPEEGYFLLDAHLDRLAASAAYFSRPADMAEIRIQLAALACKLPPRPHKVRLLLPEAGKAVLEASPWSQCPGPYRLRLASRPIDSQDRFLYHKTSHRQVYRQALAEAPGFDDVLLWNEQGEVTESCIANLIVEREGELLTPPTRCGLLPGTYRSLLLAQGKIREAVIRIEDLPGCARFYLINSVRGWWEVQVPVDRGFLPVAG